MKKIIYCCALLIFVTSCKYGYIDFFYRDNNVEKRVAGLKDIASPFPDNNHPGQYSVVLFSDSHFGATKYPAMPAEKFFLFLDKLIETNAKPAFTINFGDAADRGYESEYSDYTAFTDKIEARGIPVYNIAGNHDIYNGGWEYWKKYCYPYTSYYHFSTNNYSWYFLDSANGTLGQNQIYNFIEKVEADDAPKLVFLHYPVADGSSFYFALSSSHERALLLDTFARSNVKYIINGHSHSEAAYDFGKFKEKTLGSFHEKGLWYLLNVDEEKMSLNITRYD